MVMFDNALYQFTLVKGKNFQKIIQSNVDYASTFFQSYQYFVFLVLSFQQLEILMSYHTCKLEVLSLNSDKFNDHTYKNPFFTKK